VKGLNPPANFIIGNQFDVKICIFLQSTSNVYGCEIPKG